MDTVISDLKNIRTLADLSDDDLGALAAICVPVTYPPGSVLAREGFDAENLFALSTGNVGIWVDHGSASADLLAVTEAPCLVGEMSVADQLPRSATIVTGLPTAGYVIDADAFRKLLEERGSIALALMQGISRLVRNSNESFVSELRERNTELEKTNRELRDAQRQLVRQERLSSLGRFSSMIIHDIRNPLSVINGYTDMLELKLGDVSDELKKYASQIKRESHRLSGLTAEWLDYSRGEIRLAYTAVTVTNLLEALKENILSTMSSRDIEVIWDIGYEGTVMLDQERMLRVLINLADNARKACRRGASVTISFGASGDLLLLKVKDTGSGMDADTLSHIFEPFYSTSERGGTGLGMYIVKTVVEAHGGSVGVESEPGEGTCVSIDIPMRV